jgi:hypothetical protein
MYEELNQKINRAWASNKAILLAELMNPGSTGLVENPFSWVGANLTLDQITWRDLNNMPLHVPVEGSIYRQLPRDMGENETFGQYWIRRQDPENSDKPSHSIIVHSLKYLNSTKCQKYADFDEAMRLESVTSQQVIEAGIASDKAREILYPVYVRLINMGYAHEDFTS